jgi:hypothetical protein
VPLDLAPPQRGKGNLGDTPRPPAEEGPPSLHCPGAASLSEFTGTTDITQDSSIQGSPRRLGSTPHLPIRGRRNLGGTPRPSAEEGFAPPCTPPVVQLYRSSRLRPPAEARFAPSALPRFRHSIGFGSGVTAAGCSAALGRMPASEGTSAIIWEQRSNGSGSGSRGADGPAIGLLCHLPRAAGSTSVAILARGTGSE